MLMIYNFQITYMEQNDFGDLIDFEKLRNILLLINITLNTSKYKIPYPTELDEKVIIAEFLK
jgi:hypothetical protein